MNISIVQLQLSEYDEARQLLLGALRIRRKYMECSYQQFYTTTAKMLDREHPPSSAFCISGERAEEVRYNTAGDIVASMSYSVVVVYMYGLDFISS